MSQKNAFYAQSGGVTSVINASASGVIETCRQNSDRIGNVFAGHNGIIGALCEELIDTSMESDADIAALKNTPSGAFGSCRFKLMGLEQKMAVQTVVWSTLAAPVSIYLTFSLLLGSDVHLDLGLFALPQLRGDTIRSGDE